MDHQFFVILIETALDSIDVSALVAGCLSKAQKKKERISLNPRSCKLLKIFAPFCTKIEVPSEMGVKDILAFRLNQFNLGAPLQWFREIYNMTEVTHEKNTKAESYCG